MAKEKKMKVTKPMETVLKKDVLRKKSHFKRYHNRMLFLTDCFMKWTKPDGGKVRGSMCLLDVEEVYIVKGGGCKLEICQEDDNVHRWIAESPEEAIEWVKAIEVIYICVCVLSPCV